MRNLISGLIIINLISSLIGFGQEQENKFTRKNKYAKKIAYSAEKCYSRAILVKDSFVYTGNSNGTLFKININTGQSKNILDSIRFGDLRDLEFVNKSMIAMRSGDHGGLIKTSYDSFEGYPDSSNAAWKGQFLDGMDFHGKIGLMVGDPKDGFFTLLKTTNGGETWTPCEGKVEAKDGEVGFAASGTNVQVLNDSTFFFVSGGLKSRFFRSNDGGKTWKITSLPYLTSESSGAYSICMISDKVGVVVGGDYRNPHLCSNTCFFTDDGGEFWINAPRQTRGYRSCVIHANGIFYACGPNGIDFSVTNGKNWYPFANGTFFALAADRTKIYATLPNGMIQIFEQAGKH